MSDKNKQNTSEYDRSSISPAPTQSFDERTPLDHRSDQEGLVFSVLNQFPNPWSGG